MPSSAVGVISEGSSPQPPSGLARGRSAARRRPKINCKVAYPLPASSLGFARISRSWHEPLAFLCRPRLIMNVLPAMPTGLAGLARAVARLPTAARCGRFLPEQVHRQQSRRAE